MFFIFDNIFAKPLCLICLLNYSLLLPSASVQTHFFHFYLLSWNDIKKKLHLHSYIHQCGNSGHHSRSLFVVLSEMFQQLLDRLILNVLQTVVFNHAEKSHNFIYHHHQVYLLFIILLANLPHLCISMYKYC